MGIFDEAKDLEQDGRNLGREHPQEADRAVQATEGFVDRETGGRMDSQVSSAGREADEFLTGQQGGAPSAQGQAGDGSGGADTGR